MVEFTLETVTPQITRITGICHERMYLVEGSALAALIDCGCGFGDLLTVVRRLTAKPLLVLLTHGHLDHAMGAQQFPAVWMSPADRAVFLQHSRLELRKAELQYTPRGRLVQEEEILPAADPDRFGVLCDGMTFELGGATLEALACPGHTGGSMVFLHRQARVLLCGDAFSNATLLMGEGSLGPAGYLHSLQALQPRLAGRFDRVLEAHGSGELPPQILDGVLQLCREVLQGQSDRVPCSFRGLDGVLARKRLPHSLERADGGIGNLLYDPAGCPPVPAE